MKKWKSEGKGTVDISLLGSFGENVIIEDGVRIFHPENVFIGNNVYIGHDTTIKGYYKDKITIGDNTWIGQKCFIHGAGGVTIETNVGIGPGVYIHAAYHIDEPNSLVLFSELGFSPITIGSGSNIGIGTIILPGVSIGKNTKIGAGAVVNKSITSYSVAVGVPAKVVKVIR